MTDLTLEAKIAGVLCDKTHPRHLATTDVFANVHKIAGLMREEHKALVAEVERLRAVAVAAQRFREALEGVEIQFGFGWVEASKTLAQALAALHPQEPSE